jgi:GNAT superfamily N-acetyltransferase
MGRREFSPITPLAPTHEVGAFVCGDAEIDHFLHHRAAAEQAARLSQVYVTTSRANEAVAAYFTLSPITVRIEPTLLTTLGIGTAPYPQIGGFLLGRMGVHTEYQRRGIGKALVIRAGQIAKREAVVVGGAFLAVDPKTDDLARWYATLDFARLSDKTRRMILPFAAVP